MNRHNNRSWHGVPMKIDVPSDPVNLHDGLRLVQRWELYWSQTRVPSFLRTTPLLLGRTLRLRQETPVEEDGEDRPRKNG